MGLETVALMVSDFEDGGVERNLSRLALGLARLGVRTSLLAGNPDHPYLAELGREVEIRPVTGERTRFLRDYLASAGPDLLVTGKLADDLAAVRARAELATGSPPPTRLVAAVGTLMSGRLAGRPWNPFRSWRETRRIRSCYRQLDGLTAVSRAVAQDLVQYFGVVSVPLAVLNNPILPDDLESRAAAHCGHPWLSAPRGPGRPPVILALGGLRRVKDFATLLMALARLPDPEVRLVIVGEGKERAALESLTRRLGLQARVDLPGFVADPFPYLASADLVALSSRREGLPNVLVESMALATPVVATDCSGGVRDLLRGGVLGPLVPLGDPQALAEALDLTLRSTLAAKIDLAALRNAAQPFRLLPASSAYLEFFAGLVGRERIAAVPGSDQTPTADSGSGL